MRGQAQVDVIEVRGAQRSFEEDEARVDALRGVDLSIARGEFVSIIGPSGSGKSTLLNLIGALDKPTVGEVIIDGHPLAACTRAELARLRSRTIGFVFQ